MDGNLRTVTTGVPSELFYHVSKVSYSFFIFFCVMIKHVTLVIGHNVRKLALGYQFIPCILRKT
jgi:hypothetical protein